MENSIVAYLSQFISQYGYIAIGGFAFLECSLFLGLFVPGESLIVIGGLFASRGELNLWILWIIAFLGAYLGDIVGYLIGYFFGEQTVKAIGKRFGYKDEHFQKTHNFFEKWGVWAVIGGRFLSIFRSLIPATVGTVKYSIHKFYLFDFIGSFLWVSTFVLLGYFVGESWHIFEKYLAIAGVSAFIIGVIIVYFIFKKKKHD